MMEIERWCILFEAESDKGIGGENALKCGRMEVSVLQSKVSVLEKGLLWCVICLEVEL